jgi:hypothetical protein
MKIKDVREDKEEGARGRHVSNQGRIHGVKIGKEYTSYLIN